MEQNYVTVTLCIVRPLVYTCSLPQEPHISTSPNSLHLSPVAVARSSSDAMGIFIYLFITKFVQLGTQIKTRREKKKKIYKNTQKVHYEVHKNHIIK